MSDENKLEREEPCDLVEAQRSDAVEKRKRFEKNVANLWGHSTLGVEAKKAAMTMLSTKTGMYAKIPLMCKADACPYSDSCTLLPYDLAPMGEFCPIETAQIEMRYAEYAQDFELDNSSFTDKNIVSEIINLDIMAERCKALMAKEGVPVIEVVAGIAENGQEYTRPEVSKHWEAYEKTLKKRSELYQLMMATRKDKKGETDTEDSLSALLSKMATGDGFVIDEKPDKIIDIEPNEINE